MFVGSNLFLGACGKHASDAILAWLANNFFVHAESLFFAYKINLRCFDEYVNSVVEQQNGAVKTKATGTKATYSLDTSVRCMNFRAHIKVHFLSRIVVLCLILCSLRFLGHTKKVTTSPCNVYCAYILLIMRSFKGDEVCAGQTLPNVRILVLFYLLS